MSAMTDFASIDRRIDALFETIGLSHNRSHVAPAAKEAVRGTAPEHRRATPEEAAAARIALWLGTAMGGRGNDAAEMVFAEILGGRQPEAQQLAYLAAQGGLYRQIAMHLFSATSDGGGAGDTSVLDARIDALCAHLFLADDWRGECAQEWAKAVARIDDGRGCWSRPTATARAAATIASWWCTDILPDEQRAEDPARRLLAESAFTAALEGRGLSQEGGAWVLLSEERGTSTVATASGGTS